MKSDMLNLKEVQYFKCCCCDCGFTIDNGENFEFITENKTQLKRFICDSCLDVIINSDKAEEWY